jgi:hypothetical protein
MTGSWVRVVGVGDSAAMGADIRLPGDADRGGGGENGEGAYVERGHAAATYAARVPPAPSTLLTPVLSH